MIAKYMVAGVAGSVLLASVAFAQSPSTSDSMRNSPAATSGMSTPSTMQTGWRASKLVGLKVYNDANESVGDINDILTDKSGMITAVVLGVGGFLGIGERKAVVPISQLQWRGDRIVAPNLTKESLQTATYQERDWDVYDRTRMLGP